ncbi:hypothetical protein J6590_051309 [Homalodisca vitripennis]|nr:hypothetical protein J6590_051309 [Homalodisca vitripennis]
MLKIVTAFHVSYPAAPLAFVVSSLGWAKDSVESILHYALRRPTSVNGLMLNVKPIAMFCAGVVVEREIGTN